MSSKSSEKNGRIILFLSPVKKENLEKPAEEYTCPDGSAVEGKQTNEAPVKYILNLHHSISEIICIVTPESKESAFDYFSKEIKRYSEKVEITNVPFYKDDSFATNVLPQIFEHIKDEDEIYLETTGGPRNAIMHLLLLSRALTFARKKTVMATYSDFNAKKVEDVTHLIELFTLIGGMQELTSFGNVRTLREYYKDTSNDKTITSLIEAIENLFEAISLCRVKKIKEKMDKFNEVLGDISENKSSDPVFNSLFPAFRQVFGKDKKLTTTGLIRWCVKSDMIQQALTIYTEKMPYEILAREKGLFGNIPEPSKDIKDYEDPYMKLFYEDFLKLYESIKMTLPDIEYNVNDVKKYIRKEGQKELIIQYIKNDIKCEEWNNETFKVIKNIKVLANAAYPKEKKYEYNEKWREKIPAGKEFLCNDEFFFGKESVSPKKYLDKFVNSIDSFTADLISLLMEQNSEEALLNKKVVSSSNNVRIDTIENLELCVKNSKYELKCNVESMQKICRDYLYIKALRNMVSHANDESDQKELEEYLSKSEYTRFSKVGINHVKDAIMNALNSIKEAR